jgi:hypothetical protein
MGTYTTPDNLYRPSVGETGWGAAVDSNFDILQARLLGLDALTTFSSIYFNVKNYGALGNGSHDDTTNIASAITAAAATGGVVFFPPGTYIFTLITLVSNVTLMGQGKLSVLKFKDSTNTNNVITATGISHAGMRDLTVDYNHANNASSTNGMAIGTSSYITIERCTFLNCRGFAISFIGDASSRGNHITVVGNNVLSPISSPNDMLLVVSDFGIVARNRVVGTNANIAIVLYESDHLIAYGNEVELASGSGHTGIGVLSMRYGNVYGNKVSGAGNGIGIGCYTEHDNASPIASERNAIWGNSLYNVGTGIQLLETNYDFVHNNRVELTSKAIEFPSSARPQAGNIVLSDNDIRYNNTTAIDTTGGPTTNLQFLRNNTNGATPSVASAATIALPHGEEVISISGTTNITSITALGHTNRRVTLVFAGILTFTDGSNLKLAGNFVTTADDTITLVCDGTNWYEVARSVN